MKVALLAFILLLTYAYGQNQLILMRHGQAEHNVLCVYNSDEASPGYFISHLTELGKEQVCQAAQKLLCLGFNNSNIEKVYVSPLPRTIETAKQLAACNLFSEDKITLEPLLRECNFGTLEGKKITPDWRQFDVESSQSIEKRALEFLRKIKEGQPTANILVVTHGCMMTAFIKELTGTCEKVQTAVPYIFPLNASVCDQLQLK